MFGNENICGERNMISMLNWGWVGVGRFGGGGGREGGGGGGMSERRV